MKIKIGFLSIFAYICLTFDVYLCIFIVKVDKGKHTGGLSCRKEREKQREFS